MANELLVNLTYLLLTEYLPLNDLIVLMERAKEDVPDSDIKNICAKMVGATTEVPAQKQSDANSLLKDLYEKNLISEKDVKVITEDLENFVIEEDKE